MRPDEGGRRHAGLIAPGFNSPWSEARFESTSSENCFSVADDCLDNPHYNCRRASADLVAITRISPHAGLERRVGTVGVGRSRVRASEPACHSGDRHSL
jgi:hypothetical protein